MGEAQAGFEVKDKQQETESSSEPNIETVETDLAVPEDSFEGDPLKNLPNLSMRDRLLMSIDILNQGAWIAMGFISNPATGAIEKDLDKARIAIDCVAFLASKVESELDESTQRELKALVSNLQVNFVQQKS